MKNKKSAVKAPLSPENKLGYKLEIGRHNFKDRILRDCIYVSYPNRDVKKCFPRKFIGNLQK